MSWFEALPAALVAAAWLIGPGVALAYALGLRGLGAWGMGPTLSVLLVSFAAVVMQKAGVTWSVLPVLGVTAVTCLVAVVLSVLFRRIAPPRRNDPIRTQWVAAAALVPAVLLGAYVVVRGIGEPDRLNQTFDAIYHYSAVSYVLESGSASSLTLAPLGNPQIPAGFYPGAWHGVTSLVVLSTGTTISVAANAVAWAIASVVWPLSMLLLVRQLVGRNTAAIAVTPVLAVTFTAFPWGLLGFGVLWPNLLGLALVPAGLGAVLAATSLAKEDILGRRRSLTMAALVLVGTGFAHPNALFSLAVLALFPFLIAVFRSGRKLYAGGRRWQGVAVVGGTLAVLFGLWVFVSRLSMFKPVREMYWPPFETPPRAVGEALLNAPNGKPGLWALSVLTLVGLVLAWRMKEHRWLIGAFAAVTFLYTLAASINRPDTRKFTGVWYNDSFRIAAIAPIVAVPLAVIGVLFIAAKLAARVPALTRAPALLRTPTALAVIVMLALLPLSRGYYAGTNIGTIRGVYIDSNPAEGVLVDRSELAFQEKLDQVLPEDAVVVNNPWDGSAIMLADIRRKAVFPHADLPWGDEQRYLAQHLADAATDPKVCTAAEKLGARYMLLANKTFWSWDNRTKRYPGIKEPSTPGAFELVASSGAIKLYKLDRCGSASPNR
ncbi:hypothetical protein SAMN05216188_10141 [Lentzea xinjiangensis]|uniref:4-amino-4-deoxy-L-arabinose transferase n=1 Tax=Lentzea xinjiangensis TaxID=402600 RepID=A0A1H8ZIB6_9PSEU|nr:DUF6541 family protein [Lentzea xinjiangensis]SEP63987.1 hypothetical protein SAMN05216188_10141 [Lentzea xinjiangensis]